jgi:hypothetical protein
MSTSNKNINIKTKNENYWFIYLKGKKRYLKIKRKGNLKCKNLNFELENNKKLIYF